MLQRREGGLSPANHDWPESATEDLPSCCRWQQGHFWVMTFREMAFFHTNFMLQTPHEEEEDHNHPSTSLTPFLPSCTPQEYHGMGSLLGKRSSNMSFATGIDVYEEITNANNGEDELSDDGSQFGEKKKRLSMEQVKMLEKSFEIGNKLEPERKLQLARALGLQPRQIAIWFQNRRARWKTKKLEKDYELLKRQFEAAKSENDALLAKNRKLQAEIMALKTREQTESINLNKETEDSSSNRSENSAELIKLDASRAAAISTTSRPLFPSSSLRPNGSVAQLFQGSSRPEIPCPNQNGKEESSLSTMFCGMDDQTGFWPWLEHHFN